MRSHATHTTRWMQTIRSHCRPIALIAAALSAACCSTTLYAQSDDDPVQRGEAIADRYIKVTGGQAAYDKIHNRVVEATLSLPAQGLELGLTIYSARPNKTFITVNAPELGSMDSGTTQTQAWSNSLMAGPALKEGEEETTTLREAVFDRFAYWRKAYDKAQYVGQSDVDGTPCHKVVLSREVGQPQTVHYEKQSGRIAKIEGVVSSPAGEFPIESYLSDYREVDGVMVAHKVRVLVMGQERIATTKTCKHNVDLPNDRFDPPQEVQELIDQQEGKG